MVHQFVEQLKPAHVLAGPYSLFENSFIIEFLEPPKDFHATVLMRATYIHGKHKLGKKHPQAPPLHLHFDQSESVIVQQGRLGTTNKWAAKDMTHTPETGLYEIVPWEPHTFWPHPDAKEDTIAYIWAHPDGVPEPMDWLFFANLLRYVSDVSEGKAKLDPFYIMAVQHASATAMVWFPRATWLGPLRWWVPWKIQGGFAFAAKLMGYRALKEEYTPKEEWEAYVHAKRA